MFGENTRLAMAINRAIQAVAKAPIRISLLALFLAIVGGGAVFSLFEDGTWWDGMYWAVVVMSTVGFGDFSPATVPGRAVFFMILPVGILAVNIIAGAFISGILQRDLERGAHEDTSELDDDFDHLGETLRSCLSEIERIKDIAGHPKVRGALAEVHAEMSPERGGSA